MAGLALLAFLVAALAPGQGDARRAILCQGKKLTQPPLGSGDNNVRGTRRNDVVYLGGGNDTWTDRKKTNDIVCGGPGNDKINGGAGNDELFGQGGNDTLRDGRTPGNDLLNGGGGSDKAYGSSGYETLIGGAGNDRLYGGLANDLINGGGGDDRASGQGGNDKVLGGAGGDNVTGANGDDSVDGGGGNDNVSGGTGDDHTKYKGGRVGFAPGGRLGPAGVKGGGGNDFIVGDTGEDTLFGGGGDDVLRGDQGADEIDGGPGRDIASFSTAAAISGLGSGSSGCSDTAGFGAVILLNQNIGCEFIDASSLVKNPLISIEDAVGSPYADRIEGDDGDNRLDGGAGDDRIEGNGGNDTAFGGPGTDRCSAETVDSCPGAGSRSAGITAELTRSIDGSATMAVLGTGQDDRILVRSIQGGYYVEADNSSRAAATDSCAWVRDQPSGYFCKADYAIDSLLIDSADGGDTLTIGAIQSQVHVTVNGGPGTDTINGGPGNDRLLGGDTGTDLIYGNGGQDLLYAGGGGPDRLFGGAARDQATIEATCDGGNYFNGGAGPDNVSYAFTRQGSVWRMTTKSGGFTRSGCKSDSYQAVSNIEGTRGDDILIGNSQKNGLIGHEGNDVFMGGGGKDYVDARDGARDKTVNCGGGKDTGLIDPGKDRPVSCETR